MWPKIPTVIQSILYVVGTALPVTNSLEGDNYTIAYIGIGCLFTSILIKLILLILCHNTLSMLLKTQLTFIIPYTIMICYTMIFITVLTHGTYQSIPDNSIIIWLCVYKALIIFGCSLCSTYRKNTSKF